MTQAEFFALVETDLHLRHVPFDGRELREFLASVWPLVEVEDTPEKWATAFLASTASGATSTSPVLP